MIIVLSPAKSLDFDSKFNYKNPSFVEFGTKTAQLITKLRKFDTKTLEKLYKVSENLAKLNFERFQGFSKKFDEKNSRPAIFAFNGDVYNGIDKENLNQNFAQNHVRILSGLYGLLKPMDLIQPYRLEMGTDFKKHDLGFKNLYEFWGDKISNKINETKSDYLINLASEEYFKAIDKKSLKSNIINMIFKESKAGKLKIVGIFAKRARGLMTNYVIKNKITDPKELKKFSENNYKFQKDLSDENNFVFVR